MIEERHAAFDRGAHAGPVQAPQQGRQEVAEIGEHGPEHRALDRLGDEAVGGGALLAPVVACVAVDEVDRRREQVAEAMGGHRHAGLRVNDQLEKLLEPLRQSAEEWL
jgi:hypothetical protein